MAGETGSRPFTLAIVGRPNVGKSTLFNRLVGKRLALVDDQPGVTRDRREGEAKLGDLRFRIVDTAGLEEAPEASLAARMRQQSERAMQEADAILFLIDARAGVTPDDRAFAAQVRRLGHPVLLAANKAEGKEGLAGAYDAYALGLGDPIALSAEHGEGLADLHEALAPLVDAHAAEAGEAEDGAGPLARPLQLAIVGRPNAGKSTLINTLVGEQRLLTGPEAGITRDSISLDWSWRGRPVRLFDTAGLRRRARITDKLEKLAASDGIRAVNFADVVVVLLDATIPFEKQDLSIVDLVAREGRALVIGLNKWDLIEDRGPRLKALRAEADRLLAQVRGVAVIPLSGASGAGTDRLMDAVFAAAEVWNTRIPTARLNQWLGGAVDAHPPPAVSGRRIKIRYMTQVKARPPHFALFGNQLDALPEAYTRYLVNGIRDAFDLPGTPIRLSLRTSSNPYDRR